MSLSKDIDSHKNDASSQPRHQVSVADLQARIDELITRTTELEVQNEEYLLGWKRAQADYQNLKKESTQQHQATTKYVTARVLQDFFPIIDNFNTALEHLPSAVQSEPWAQGLFLLRDQYLRTLEQMGVTPIDAVGKQFDVQCMEAIDQVEDQQVESGTVVQQVREGYLLHDEVITPAQVVVAK